MSAPGELVPDSALRGEVLPPAVPVPKAGGGGSVYADFMGRLRDYVAPPPPGELGWQAIIGVGMMLGAAGLLALLPAGHTIANGRLLKWVGQSSLASAVDSVDGLVEPLALFGMVVLLGVAAIYIARWGATPALVFLTAQSWLGVAALAVAVFTWVYVLVIFVANLVIWFLVGVAIVVAFIFALIILGLLLGS